MSPVRFGSLAAQEQIRGERFVVVDDVITPVPMSRHVRGC